MPPASDVASSTTVCCCAVLVGSDCSAVKSVWSAVTSAVSEPDDPVSLVVEPSTEVMADIVAPSVVL